MKYSLTIETDDLAELGKILQTLGGDSSLVTAPRPTSVKPDAARMIEALTKPPLPADQEMILRTFAAADPDEWVPFERTHPYFAERGAANPADKARGMLSVLAGRIGRAFRGQPDLPKSPITLLAEVRFDVGSGNSYRLTPLGREAIHHVLG